VVVDVLGTWGRQAWGPTTTTTTLAITMTSTAGSAGVHDHDHDHDDGPGHAPRAGRLPGDGKREERRGRGGPPPGPRPRCPSSALRPGLSRESPGALCWRHPPETVLQRGEALQPGEAPHAAPEAQAGQGVEVHRAGKSLCDVAVATGEAPVRILPRAREQSPGLPFRLVLQKGYRCENSHVYGDLVRSGGLRGGG
jgi:hypothetical protein